jgi:glutathione S-transferase
METGMLKLIVSLTSPYARKVRIVAAEKKIDIELVVDVPWDADTRVPQYNPLGKVPVLLLEDGSSLYDSRVIVDFLDHASPVAHLIPADPYDRIQVKCWEALADGIIDAAVVVYNERKRPEAQQSRDWIVRQEGKISRSLEAISETLGERKYCYGGSSSLADIAVGCALGYLNFRLPEIAWRQAHPNLEQLYERLMARASFKSTVPVV